MTGSISPVSTSAASPVKVAAPSLLAIGAPADGAPGVPNLAAFIDLMIGKTAVAPKDQQSGDERQDDAAPGKSLPDAEDDKGDPALAWLMAVAPIVFPPAPPAQPAAVGGAPSATAPATTAPALPVGAPISPSLPATDAPQALVAADAAAPVSSPVAPPAAPPVTSVAAPTDPAPIVLAAATDGPVTVKPTVQAKVAIDRAEPARPVAQPIRVAVPAATPAALAASGPAAPAMPALFALAMAPSRDAESDSDRSAPGGIAAAATLLSPTDAASLIAKPGGAQGQALDMGRQDWPQKMIDRIETLRDDANANDTSIRLKPEALGRVDISLRTHADGAVSVHFAAEQPATRTMIADAAPQLNAAAEARGIRLAGTSVDLSGSGTTGGDRPRPQFELQQNVSNHLSANGGDDIQAVADGRIA